MPVLEKTVLLSFVNLDGMLLLEVHPVQCVLQVKPVLEPT